jgi:hypothetical protein
VCRSDADSQLLLYFPFNQTVKLAALVLNAPEGQAPTVLKLYANKPSLGFEDLEDVEPTQTIALSAKNFGDDVQTRIAFVKFQAVNSLHMFVENGEGPVSALSTVKFIGVPVAGMDIKAIKKVGDDHE